MVKEKEKHKNSMFKIEGADFFTFHETRYFYPIFDNGVLY